MCCCLAACLKHYISLCTYIEYIYYCYVCRVRYLCASRDTYTTGFTLLGCRRSYLQLLNRAKLNTGLLYSNNMLKSLLSFPYLPLTRSSSWEQLGGCIVGHAQYTPLVHLYKRTPLAHHTCTHTHTNRPGPVRADSTINTNQILFICWLFLKGFIILIFYLTLVYDLLFYALCTYSRIYTKPSVEIRLKPSLPNGFGCSIHCYYQFSIYFAKPCSFIVACTLCRYICM